MLMGKGEFRVSSAEEINVEKKSKEELRQYMREALYSGATTEELFDACLAAYIDFVRGE